MFSQLINLDFVLGLLDVGQFVGIGESKIDRFTSWYYCTNWFGYAFSQKFWDRLSDGLEYEPEEFHKGAYSLDTNGEFDAFVSYRGASGQAMLYLTVAGMHNIHASFWFLVAFCPVVVISLAFVRDPCSFVPEFFFENQFKKNFIKKIFGYLARCDFQNVDAKMQKMFFRQNFAKVLFFFSKFQKFRFRFGPDSCKATEDPSDPPPRWFVFQSFGSLILFALISYWHPAMAWTNNAKLFVDKYC